MCYFLTINIRDFYVTQKLMKNIKLSRTISLFAIFCLLFSLLFPINKIEVKANNYCSITVQDEEDGSAIANSTFIIRNSEGKTLTFNYSGGYYVFSDNASNQELKTNVAGKILVENLPDGQYTAIQKSLPNKYNSALKTKSFNTNNNSSITITNSKKYGAIAIKVVDSDNISHQISNIGFSIKDSRGSLVKFTKTNSSYTYTSNSSSSATTRLYSDSGRIDIYKLPIGKYTLIQNSTNSRYNIARETSFSVDNTKNTQKIITVKNNQKTGKLIVSNSVSRKATYNLLSGDNVLKFNQNSGGNYTYSVNGSTSNLKTSGGELNVSNLPAGSYILKISSAPDGYTAVNYTKTINIAIEKTSSVTFEFSESSSNHPVSNDGKIHVVDENNNNLKNVGIAITNENGGTVKTVKTDSSGDVSISDLSEGKYNFKVSSVPDGYVLDTSTKFSFTINKDGSVSSIPIITVKNIAVYIQHPDKVKDIEFTIYNDYNEKVNTALTNDDGLAVFKNLLPGTYTIKQTAAPDGHSVSPAIKTIIITNSFNNSAAPIIFNNTNTTETIEPTTLPQESQEETLPPFFADDTTVAPTEEASLNETQPTDNKETDSSNLWLWIVLACIAGVAIGATAAIVANKKKAKKEQELEALNGEYDYLSNNQDDENEASSNEVQSESSYSDKNEDMNIDETEGTSEEEIEEQVGLLENSSPDLDLDAKPEEENMQNQIDNAYGTDVGEYKDESTTVQTEDTLTIDTENSDVGEIENVKAVVNDGPNEIEETIDKLYGGDAGELSASSDTDVLPKEVFTFDTAKEDVGILTTTKTIAPDEEAKEEEKSIDDIYGEDVGELTPSEPVLPKKPNYSSSKKKNRKRRKK